MKKVLLALGVLITVCNLTLGIAYPAVCQDRKGARACGTSCSAYPDGTCVCQGNCTADEMKWVGGAGGGDEELLME